MKSRIWRLAGVGVLCISVTAPSLADESHTRGTDDGQRGQESRHGNIPPRAQSNDIIRGDNSQQFEQSGQPRHGGQSPNNPPRDYNNPVRPPPPPPQLPANSLPIQGRPDSVQQTEPPRRGYYQDIPRRHEQNPHWQNNGPRPDHPQWPGRPNGHGNGWGSGPQYRPGHVIDRFPDRDYRVPYRGQDYFYSGGYWYRPLGPRYVVVQPPRGIRVRYLPDYAQEVWVGGALLFLAAGSYYAYQQNSQDYVVVEPPVQPPPQPANNGYDVEAYPANGQSPEQVNRDGYECYQYAVQQSGFDPRTATYQPAPSVVQAYRKAQGSCLSSRGYQVNY